MRLLRSGVFMFVMLVAGFVPVLANEIDAKTAHALAQAGELTIIDIRRPAEWRKTGVPEGSFGISLQNFSRKVRGQFPGDVLAAVDGDKGRSIALICASGGRSARALGLLQEAGFSRVQDISEGMFGNGKAPGWLARNLPVATCKGC